MRLVFVSVVLGLSLAACDSSTNDIKELPVECEHVLQNAAIFDQAIESTFVPGQEPTVRLSIKESFDPIGLRSMVIDGTGHWVATCVDALEADGYDLSWLRGTGVKLPDSGPS